MQKLRYALDLGHVEAQIAALRGERGEGEAQRIGAERRDAVRKLLARRLLDGRLHLRLHQAGGALGEQLIERDAVDDVERVDDVALGLRHLLAVVVADEAVDVDLAKRHLARELEAHHDHAGDPEEDDVEAGHQHRGRVVGLERRASRSGQPCVENGQSAEENHVSSTSSSWRNATRGVDAVRGARLRLAARDVPAALLVVPGGNAVAPPELAADAPVLDLAHPLEIHAGPVVGDEADAPALDRARSRASRAA